MIRRGKLLSQKNPQSRPSRAKLSPLRFTPIALQSSCVFLVQTVIRPNGLKKFNFRTFLVGGEEGGEIRVYYYLFSRNGVCIAKNHSFTAAGGYRINNDIHIQYMYIYN